MPRRCHLLLAAAALAAAVSGLTQPALGTQAELDEVLDAATRAALPPAPLRADGEIVVRNPDGTTRDQVRILVRPDGTVRLELRRAGVRVLVTPPGKAWIWRRGDGRVRECAPGDPVPGTDLVCEDLRPFSRNRFRYARIADWGGRRMTVTLSPADSHYSLYVVTFDRKRHVPLKTLLYRETLNNLVKMRVERDHVVVGRQWLPRTVSLEDFALRSTTELRLRWAQAADLPPELFDPDLLGREPPLPWPSPPSGGAAGD